MGLFNEMQELKKIGCTDVKPYTLVSNYGFTFSRGGVTYDLRYWGSCYGVYGGGWSVCAARDHIGSPQFGDDFSGVVEWIKNNL